ncbi:MAG: hypothetical protein AAGC79_00055 [Pseudomonadota bacterium]
MTSFVDEQMRFFFVHVPKTGGMTVTRFFARGRNRAWRLERSLLNAKIGIHDGAGEIARLLGPSTERYFSFAYYRNSWDWAFSLYRYVKRTPDHEWHERVRDLSFSDYVQDVAEAFYRPQRPLVAPKGKIAVSRLEDFRALGDSLPDILEELGYDPGALCQENAAPERIDYREAYDRASQEAIARIYRDDIEFFDFRFGR